MASSIIHLAITNELTRLTNFSDPDRLRLGSILPDGTRDSSKSHMKTLLGDNKKTYALESYRAKFAELMQSDDLYLGYYLHLIQDLLFRKFMYTDYSWCSRIPENIQRLHRDYEIINGYMIEKYGLSPKMIVPAELTNERIRELGEFNVTYFVEYVKKDFIPTDFKDVFFFTAAMADEFTEQAVSFCTAELTSLRNGKEPLCSVEWSWIS